MIKILHVAVREFLATVATKGFLFGIVIMPVIMLVAILGMWLLFSEEAPRVAGEVAVVDPTGEVHAGLREYLQPEKIAERRDDFRKKVAQLTSEAAGSPDGPVAADAARQQALEAVLGQVPKLEVVELEASVDVEAAKEPLHQSDSGDGGRLALVVVHEDAVVKAADKERYGSYELFVREKLDDRVEGEIRSGIRDSIADARVRNAGLDRELINALTRVEWVRSKTVTEEGEEETNEIFSLLLPGAFMLLLFMSVMTGGQSLMTSTVEEKSSRVVELLLSAVSPMQLMTGKILGQMCVGLLLLTVYAGMGMFSLVMFSALSGRVELYMLLYLGVFYLIAYFIVASLLSAIGAAVNEMREAQSLQGPVMAILIIPWVLWMPISRNPDSIFAQVTSFLPPLNPFVMLVRLASNSPPPWWHALISILIGLVAVYGALWFAAKVFRVGLLMYGKPPNFRTLIKWVRMA